MPHCEIESMRQGQRSATSKRCTARQEMQRSTFDFLQSLFLRVPVPRGNLFVMLKTRSGHFQIRQVVVERLPQPRFVGGELLNLLSHLFDLVFLIAELLHVALVQIGVAIQLAHVLADAGLLLRDRGDLLLQLRPALA